MALLRLRRKQQKHAAVSGTIPIPPGSVRKWRADNSVRSHRSTLSRVREKEEPAGDVPRARPIGRVVATWNLFAGGKQAAEVERRSRESARVSAVREVTEEAEDAKRSLNTGGNEIPIVTTVVREAGDLSSGRLTSKSCLPFRHWCHKRKSTFFSINDQSTSWLAFGHP